MNRDWEVVSYLMKAQSYTVDDKHQVMKAFLASYGVHLFVALESMKRSTLKDFETNSILSGPCVD